MTIAAKSTPAPKNAPLAAGGIPAPRMTLDTESPAAGQLVKPGATHGKPAYGFKDPGDPTGMIAPKIYEQNPVTNQFGIAQNIGFDSLNPLKPFSENLSWRPAHDVSFVRPDIAAPNNAKALGSLASDTANEGIPQWECRSASRSFALALQRPTAPTFSSNLPRSISRSTMECSRAKSRRAHETR